MCRVGLYTERYIPTLFPWFLLICYPYISLHFSCFFGLVYITWCKFELKFAIFHRAAKCWSPQASSVSMGWRITDLWHLFKHRVNVDWKIQTNSPPSPCTRTILLTQRTWVMIRLCCYLLCAHAYNKIAIMLIWYMHLKKFVTHWAYAL